MKNETKQTWADYGLFVSMINHQLLLFGLHFQMHETFIGRIKILYLFFYPPTYPDYSHRQAKKMAYSRS